LQCTELDFDDITDNIDLSNNVSPPLQQPQPLQNLMNVNEEVVLPQNQSIKVTNPPESNGYYYDLNLSELCLKSTQDQTTHLSTMSKLHLSHSQSEQKVDVDLPTSQTLQLELDIEELIRQKEEIENDNSMNKKRKQNLKKKLRKKLTRAYDRLTGVSESMLEEDDSIDDSCIDSADLVKCKKFPKLDSDSHTCFTPLIKVIDLNVNIELNDNKLNTITNTNTNTKTDNVKV